MTLDISILEHANELMCTGNLTQAEEIASEYLRFNPTHYAPWYLLGLIRYHQTRYEDAQDNFLHAIQLAPNHAELHNCLAVTYAAQSQYSNAVQHYLIALKHAPNHAPYLINYARTQCDQNKMHSALEILASLPREMSENPETLSLQAEIALKEHRLEPAHELITAALVKQPNHFHSHYIAGNIEYNRFQWKHAVNHFNVALEQQPTHITSIINKAHALFALNEDDKAISLLTSALRTQPASAQLTYALALIELASGNYASGWRHFLARPGRARHKQLYQGAPLPSNLKNKNFLVLGDEGVGDELFFLRYIQEIQQRGGNIRYITSPRLSMLLADFYKNNQLNIVHSDVVFDYIIAGGDLPYLLGDSEKRPRPDSIKIPANSIAVEKVKKKLESFGPPPYIGITWRAGPYLSQPTSSTNALYKKQISLETLAEAIASVRATFVIIQRSVTPFELSYLEKAIFHPWVNYSDASDNLEEIHGLLSILDQYISVSNTNIHLRESLGLNSIVLLNHPAEWRWGKSISSAWFPKSTLLHQQSDGDWGPSMTHLSHILETTYEQTANK